MHGYRPDCFSIVQEMSCEVLADRERHSAVERHVTGPYVTVAGTEPATRTASIV